jgi:hypothetical protein
MCICIIHSLHKIPTGVLNSDKSFLMHLFQTENNLQVHEMISSNIFDSQQLENMQNTHAD